MTTETTPIERAMTIIKEQRELLETYNNLLAAYDKRQESMVKYLETIYGLISAGLANDAFIKDAELGMEHLDRLINRSKKKEQTA